METTFEPLFIYPLSFSLLRWSPQIQIRAGQERSALRGPRQGLQFNATLTIIPFLGPCSQCGEERLPRSACKSMDGSGHQPCPPFADVGLGFPETQMSRSLGKRQLPQIQRLPGFLRCIRCRVPFRNVTDMLDDGTEMAGDNSIHSISSSLSDRRICCRSRQPGGPSPTAITTAN